MLLASALCKTKIDAVIKSLQAADVDPLEEQGWDKNIVQPAIALVQTMQLLSAGWSGGLIGISLTSWCMAFSFFCKVVNWEYFEAADALHGDNRRLQFILNFVFFVSLPLLLAYDVAQTSSSCDALMDALNSVRLSACPTFKHHREHAQIIAGFRRSRRRIR